MPIATYTVGGQWGPATVIDLAGRPQPGAAVALYLTDGATLAVRYTDSSKATPAANPWTADTLGSVTVIADPGPYILKATVAGVTTPYRIEVPVDPVEVALDEDVAAEAALRVAGDAATLAGANAHSDALFAGFPLKYSVKAAATGSLSGSGLPVVDGYQTVAGDLILAPLQADPTANGIYQVHAGGWTRPADFAVGLDVTGAVVAVEAGAANGQTVWLMQGAGPIIVGTTPQVWVKVNAGAAPPSGPAGGDLGGFYPNPSVPALVTLAGAINTNAIAISAETNNRAAADATLVPLAQKGAANGVATLDAGSKIPSGQLPSIAITDTFVVASQAAMLALTAQTGDVAVRTDLGTSLILQGADPTVLANWVQLDAPGGVTSVNGQTGTVTGLATNTYVDTQDAAGLAAAIAFAVAAAYATNALQHGVKGDVVTVADAAITAGTNQLHSASATFAAGQYVQVVGAGAPFVNRGAWSAANTYAFGDYISDKGYYAGAAIAAKAVFSVEGWAKPPAGVTAFTLMAKILSVAGGVATLDTSATTTVAGAICVYGTDDTAALTALGADQIYLPGNRTYFVADWYLQSHTRVMFGPGAVVKLSHYSTTNPSVMRLMSAVSSPTYIEDIHLEGRPRIDYSELTPPSGTIPRGVHIQNCQDWTIEALHGRGLPGTTGNVLLVGANSSLAAARRGKVGVIHNDQVRGVGSSCVQHTAGTSIEYGLLTCDGGVAFRNEMDDWDGVTDDVHVQVAYANGDSGFPGAAVFSSAHTFTIRNTKIDCVLAEGGADGWSPSYSTGSVQGVEIDRLRVAGGGSGISIGGNDHSFPGCVVKEAYVTGASLTSLHDVTGSNPGTGFQVAPGMTLVNARAVSCASYGFYDINATGGPVAGSVITLINCEGTSNTGPGCRFRGTERVVVVGGKFGDVPAYATPITSQMLGSTATTGTLAGWGAGPGASGVSGSGGVLTVTADGTSTSAVARTATGTSGVAVTPLHYYKFLASAAVGTAPAGATAVVSLWFYKSDGTVSNALNGSTALAIPASGSVSAAFSFQAPADAAFVAVVVKFFSNVLGATLTAGWTALWSGFDLQELSGLATQTYGLQMDAGTTAELFAVDLRYNGSGQTAGAGTVRDYTTLWSQYQAAGDLLVGSAAGAFARLAQGGDGSYLGVSGGTLGYYTPAAGVSLTANAPKKVGYDAGAVGTGTAAARDDHEHAFADGNHHPKRVKLLGSSFPSILLGQTQRGLTTGVLWVVKVPIGNLDANTTISNISVCLQAVGATLTSGDNLLGVYKKDGSSLLGKTADQTTAWTTSGNLKITLAAAIVTPFTVTPADENDEVYVGMLFVGSTSPNFYAVGANGVVALNGALAASDGYLLGSTGSSLTALPSSFTPASMSQQSIIPWVALT